MNQSQEIMFEFVRKFRLARKNHCKKLSGKRAVTNYYQTARLDHLRNYLGNRFTGSGTMKNSEIFDFVVYLLEGFLKREYGDYETYNEFYEQKYGDKKNGGY